LAPLIPAGSSKQVCRQAQASKSAGRLKQASLPAGSSRQVNKKIKKEEVKA